MCIFICYLYILCSYYIIIFIDDIKSYSISRNGIFPLIYSVLFISIGAFSLSTFSNSILNASVVSCYSTLQPLLSAFMSYIIYNEKLSWSMIGGVGIFLGLYYLITEK